MSPKVITTFINQQFAKCISHAVVLCATSYHHGTFLTSHYCCVHFTREFCMCNLRGAHRLEHLIVLAVRRLRQARQPTLFKRLSTASIKKFFMLAFAYYVCHLARMHLLGTKNAVTLSRCHVCRIRINKWCSFSHRRRLTIAKKNLLKIYLGADCWLDFTKLFNWDGFHLASTAYWPWQCVNFFSRYKINSYLLGALVFPPAWRYFWYHYRLAKRFECTFIYRIC